MRGIMGFFNFGRNNKTVLKNRSFILHKINTYCRNLTRHYFPVALSAFRDHLFNFGRQHKVG